MKAALLRRIPEAARSGLLLFIFARLVTLVIAWIVMAARPELGISEIFTNWDGNWNEIVATDWYKPFETIDPSSILRYQSMAFFPLLPLSTRLIHEVSGVGIGVLGPLVAMTFGALGFASLGKYLAEKVGQQVALAAMLLMLFSPSGFVLSMFYTEGLMILLTVLTMQNLDDEKWVKAGLWAILGGLTRPTGFVLFAPCLVAAITHIRARGLRESDARRALFAPALAPVGFVIWVVVVAVRTGEPGGYFSIQSEGWGARLDFGKSFLAALYRTVVDFDRNLDIRISVVYLAIFGFGGLYLAWRQKMAPSWIALAAVLVLVTAFNARQSSGARFLLPAFPLFVAWVRLIPRQWNAAVVAGSASLMGALFLTSIVNLNYTP